MTKRFIKQLISSNIKMFKWYKKLANFERNIGMPGSIRIPSAMLLVGILSYCGSHEYVLSQNRKLRAEVEELRPSVAVEERIDRDELPDLVIGDRIFLAEGNGVYRRLSDSDIYKVR